MQFNAFKLVGVNMQSQKTVNVCKNEKAKATKLYNNGREQ